MLEKAPDDAFDADIVGEAWNPWTQAADAAHDEIDAHPRLRGPIEKINGRRVDESVHLRPDLGRLPLFRISDLGLDQLDEPRPERKWRDRDLLETGRAGIAGHEI